MQNVFYVLALHKPDNSYDLDSSEIYTSTVFLVLLKVR